MTRMLWTSQTAGRGCFGGAPFDTESESIMGNDARKLVTDGYPLEQVRLQINREGARGCGNTYLLSWCTVRDDPPLDTLSHTSDMS